jgi:hypothetical protein
MRDWIERNGLDPDALLKDSVVRGAFEEGWQAGREALGMNKRRK